jgi:hypothetical protein
MKKRNNIMKIVEFTTVYGITYIGKKIDKINTNDVLKVHFKDVMMVSMKPVKVDAERYNMVPALDIINVFSEENEFSFNSNDIVYMSNVERENFLNMYNDTVKMYSDAKVKHGDINTEQVDTDVSIQK